MATRRTKWFLWGSLILIPLVVVSAFICMAVFNVFHAHEHCIKQTGLAFRMYADDHGGSLPSDSKGFGNALLLLVIGGYLGDTNGTYSIALITGPGDDGAVFREALKTSAPIPEAKCSRVYVQGLSEKSDPQIALFFDKKSCPGGDHFRRPWGPLLREVCLLDGSMQIIAEKDWPAFSSNQVELLVHAGITRETAQHYYKIP